MFPLNKPQDPHLSSYQPSRNSADSHRKPTAFTGNDDKHQPDLSEIELRYQTIINTMSEGVIMQAQDGTVQTCNPAAERILGLSANTIIGFNLIDVRSRTIHEDGSPFLTETYPSRVTLRTGESLTNVIMGVYKRDDTLVWVSMNSRPMIHPDEMLPYAVVTTFIDITVQKRVETALLANELRLGVLVEIAPVGILELDSNGIIERQNYRMLEISGVLELENKQIERFKLVHPDDRERVLEIFQSAIKSGQQYENLEYRYLHLDGSFVWVSSNMSPIFDEHWTITGFIVSVSDITEHKRLEMILHEKENLQAMLAKELELSLLKSHMMERITHEFRTPLTILQITSETLIHYYARLSEDQKTHKLSVIYNTNLHLTDMLEEIQLVVTGQLTPSEIHTTPVDLIALCQRIALNLETRFELPGKFVLDIPAPAIIPAEYDVLRSALFHIMRNAARFSLPAAVVYVSLSQQETGVELKVVDTGIGILPAEQSRLFEPFFRGSNLDEISGLGLGLAIALAAITAHKGSITVESIPEQGTTVKIWLPSTQPN